MASNPAQVAAYSDDKRRVLDATDIVRLVGEHIALKQRGREYVGLCPFHDDHTPSMCVVPHKQFYKCFSCGAGGDAITFVREYHKMSFREALEHLAERAGIQLAPRREWRAAAATPERREQEEVGRAGLIAANQTAATFFRTILQHGEHGAAARALVSRRGISAEMVETFELGASPDMWDGLVRTIASKGLEPGAFRAAGLLKQRESGGGLYDAFRNRLMFPIHDQLGRVIAFGGRRINDEDDPKYLNSSESPVFDKSSTLYGLHQAAQEIRRSGRAIVCEGYMDAIACHQGGIGSAVATLGTAMTAGNARLLRRLCDQVVLLFDGDAAGQKAAERAVEIFFAEPVDVRIATLSSVTDAKDPDELLKREGGRALLDEAVSRAIDPMELLFAGVRQRVRGQGISGRSRVVDEFLARLVELGLGRVDSVRQRLIIKRVSQIVGVDWDTIAGALSTRRQMAGARQRAAGTTLEPKPGAPLSAAEHLLGCVLCEPSLLHALTEEQAPVLEPDAYAEGPMQQVARAVASLVVDERDPGLREVLEVLDEPEAQRAATRLATEVDRLTDGESERLHRHWRERLRVAMLEREGSPAPEIGASAAPGTTGRDDPWANLVQVQDARRRLGPDPRVMPRAGPA